MRNSRMWWVAGATAGLLAVTTARPARADYASADQKADASDAAATRDSAEGYESAAGERTESPSYPAARRAARRPTMERAAGSRTVERAPEPEGRVVDDATELQLGNTGGRG